MPLCAACLSPIQPREAHVLIGCADGHVAHRDCLRDWQRTPCARGLRQRARSDAAFGAERQAFPCPQCCLVEKGFGFPAIGGGGGDDDVGGGDADDDEEEEEEEEEATAPVI